MPREYLNLATIVYMLNDGGCVPDCEVKPGMKSRRVYTVCVNVPGYMPDSPPMIYTSKRDAMRAAADERRLSRVADQYVVTIDETTIGELI